MRSYLRLWALTLAVIFAGESSNFAATDPHGHVFFAEIPIPGAVVSAMQSGNEVRTVTDSDGAFSFAGLTNGSWTIRVEMPGFLPVRRIVTIPADAVPIIFQLTLLTVADTEEPSAKAEKPPRYAEHVSDATEVLLINGSLNSGDTRAFGNNRGKLNSPLYSADVNLTANNSALDARSFSLTGQKVPDTAYIRSEASITMEGPLPVSFRRSGPRFTLVYNRMQNQDVTLQTARVPTQAERIGDFSNDASSVTDPISGLPFPGNRLPGERISPQALALLRFYPVPNVFPASSYNYQQSIVAATHRDYFQLQTAGSVHGHQLSGNFGFQSTRTDSPNLSGFIDRLGVSVVTGTLSWSRSIANRYSTTVTYALSETTAKTAPHFAYRDNVSGRAGITGNSQEPQNWGPPNLNFSGGIASLQNAQYGLDRTQSHSVSQSGTWNRERHTFSHGFGFMRQHFNPFSERDARGTFTFTGAISGNDFADFLLGLPAASSISFANSGRYFRQSFFDAFVMDDWKVTASLTVNSGIRWEYEAPVEERYQQLVNLDIAPGYGSVAPVLAEKPVGLLTGRVYPRSLVRLDRTGFQPRLGVAWRPWADTSFVVRAGYGIYRDTSVYRTIADQMSRQFPFSTTMTAQNSASSPLTLANGFLVSAGAPPVTFAVDPDFRVGYAQNWQLSLQDDLSPALQVTVTYLGIKGTRLPQRTLPQTFPAGSVPLCSCPAGYVFLSSNGNSNQHAATIQLRRRQTARFGSSVEYTWSKAIDDSGLGGAHIAQDWMNPGAERAMSNFDRRHRLTVQTMYTSGLLAGTGRLSSGWVGALLREWTVMAEWRMNTGLPLTPILIAPVQGTGITGTLRPDNTGAPLYRNGPEESFLNAGAFSVPVSGRWGNAGRNSIRSPRQFFLDASIGRRFALNGGIGVDLRVDFTNVLNHVTFADWNTAINSSQFGLPVRANSMRTIRPSLQVRF
jgi:Carboxypeptidase regulatory-like domain